MPIVEPLANESVSSYIKAFTLDEIRAATCWNVSIPNVSPIRTTDRTTYQVKDCSSFFKSDGRKSKTQWIPTVDGLVAQDFVRGSVMSYQDITRSRIEISVNQYIQCGVMLFSYDKDWMGNHGKWHEMSDMVQRISRAMAERIHMDIGKLALIATPATYGGSAIGGATIAPSHSLFSNLKSMARYNDLLSTGSWGQSTKAFISGSQYSQLTSNMPAPYNELGERGMKEYETGDVVAPIAGVNIGYSNLMPQGSTVSSTYNMFMVGEEALGIGFGFSEWIHPAAENDAQRGEKHHLLIEYGTFLLDPRRVFKFELQNF